MMPIRLNPHNQHGLTLIEVLAAVVLLGIVVIAFVQLSDQQWLATTKSSKTTLALQIADQTLTTIRHELETKPGELTYPLTADPNLPPFTCTAQSFPAPHPCTQLPAGFELIIVQQPYTAAGAISLAPSSPDDVSPGQVTVPSIMNNQGVSTLLAVTVRWEVSLP